MIRRIVFDIRTLVESRGPSDGIGRTVRALARFAARNRPDVLFAIYDTEIDAFLLVRNRWIDAILEGATVDTSHIPDPLGRRKRFRERLPPRLRRWMLTIQRPRRRAFLLTERLRLEARKPSAMLARVQGWLMSEKYRVELTDERGIRRTLLPFDMATGPPIALSPRDVIVLPGSDLAAMHRLATRAGAGPMPRLAVLCHDIIPLLLPDFFRPLHSANFRTCFHALFPASALTILTSHCVERDVQDYCKENGLALGATEVVPLGSDFAPAVRSETVMLPPGLRDGGYALFVSTIEPRKNHRLLFDVWKRLLACGVPQQHDFKLVFVGRRGWMMKDFLDEMRAHPSFGRSLFLFAGIDDATLGALYANSAFCVYPSFYEGFGLPVVEGFRYRKAVIASTGGALPETVQGCAPCIDPSDQDAWFTTLKDWIENPSARDRYEAAIRSQFRLRDWNTAGKHLFDAIDRVLPDVS